MRPLLGVALLFSLLFPTGSWAAIAEVRTEVDDEVPAVFGVVTYKAQPGERNKLVISVDDRGQLVFQDRVRVHARGECDQLGPKRAACPRTEDSPEIYLRDRADRVRSFAGYFEQINGGPGGDVIRGARGWDVFDGGAGDDRLYGRGGDDQLTGGRGRDRLGGGGGDDSLFDGETDRQAARDVFVGGASADTRGPDPGDKVSYSERRGDLSIDLAGRPAARTNTEDILRGLESIDGGSGDDRLSGDGDDNGLFGGAGEDVLNARGGADIPSGGESDDRVGGGSGRDVVWGDAGRDRLSGGAGADFVISAEEGNDPGRGDRVTCGSQADDVRSEHRDRLMGSCERSVAFSNGLNLRVQPEIDADSAAFTVTCTGGAGDCDGDLTLSGPRGRQYGTTHFDIAGSDTETVVVQLNAAGASRLAAGTVAQVRIVPDSPPGIEAPGGYRTFMRGGG